MNPSPPKILTPGYLYRSIDESAFESLLREHAELALEADKSLPVQRLFSARERQSVEYLSRALAHHQALYWQVETEDQELAGWCFGLQRDESCFELVQSLILPEHRQRGLYTALLRALLKWAAKQGYQQLLSRQNAHLNAALIPKLRLGFYLNGLQLSDRRGLLAELCYYLNRQRRELWAHRAGDALSPALQDRLFKAGYSEPEAPAG